MPARDCVKAQERERRLGTLALHGTAARAGAYVSRVATLLASPWVALSSVVSGAFMVLPAASRGNGCARLFESAMRTPSVSVWAGPSGSEHVACMSTFAASPLWWTTFACIHERRLERETGIEPATSSLGSSRSTAELLPHPRPESYCSSEPVGF
jgi:hypothetical protein